MKTKTITTQQKTCGAVLPSLTLFGMLLMAPLANAATIPFIDDFEDGNLDTWLQVPPNPIPPGKGFTNVVSRNGSLNAHISKTGGTSDFLSPDSISLSQEFDYSAGLRISFDMEALSTTLTPTPLNLGDQLFSESGVRMSFLDAGSLVLGTYTISNNSDPSVTSSVGIEENFLVDIGSAFTVYPETFLGIYAGQTGAGSLYLESDISTFKLEFFAAGQSAQYGDSSSQVWFDNVKVVPVPAALWLFGSGLVGLIGVARRKKA